MFLGMHMSVQFRVVPRTLSRWPNQRRSDSLLSIPGVGIGGALEHLSSRYEFETPTLL